MAKKPENWRKTQKILAQICQKNGKKSKHFRPKNPEKLPKSQQVKPKKARKNSKFYAKKNPKNGKNPNFLAIKSRKMAKIPILQPKKSKEEDDDLMLELDLDKCCGSSSCNR